MDFIVKLPISKDPVTQEEYDAILVMVDRLTKLSHLVPFNKKYTAEQLGFFANFFKDPNLFGIELPHRLAESAIQRVETLKRIHGNIIKIQEHSGNY